MNIEIEFYDTVADELIKFAVIITKSNEKWVFCKHRDRDSLEIPGGHRELAENIDTTAKRELYEETGAVDYKIKPVCCYSVTGNISRTNFVSEKSFGKLYFADVSAFEEKLYNEIEEIVFSDKPSVDNWTYPVLQPQLIEEARRRNCF